MSGLAAHEWYEGQVEIPSSTELVGVPRMFKYLGPTAGLRSAIITATEQTKVRSLLDLCADRTVPASTRELCPY